MKLARYLSPSFSPSNIPPTSSSAVKPFHLQLFLVSATTEGKFRLILAFSL